MPFILIRNDIVKVRADAIVNPANELLLEGSGTSRAIFLAAGERDLKAACSAIGSCLPGKAVATDAFKLNARYIIHAVCPVWQGGGFGEEERLVKTYMSALKLADEKKCRSAAFPLLSSGSCGFPKDKAMKAAVTAASDFLEAHDMTIYMVLYDRKSLAVSKKLFSEIKEYIDDNYADENSYTYICHEREARPGAPEALKRRGYRSPRASMPGAPAAGSAAGLKKPPLYPYPAAMSCDKSSLDEMLNHLDETFSERLLRLIDERGLKDSYVYKKANIDRRHFSKIRSNAGYKPAKRTVFAFAVALRLSLDETEDLLKSAGYSISGSSRFDIIMSFFIKKGIYDIYEINELLFAYGEPVIGQ